MEICVSNSPATLSITNTHIIIAQSNVEKSLPLQYIFAATFSSVRNTPNTLKLSNLDLTQFPPTLQQDSHITLHYLHLKKGGKNSKPSYHPTTFTCPDTASAELCLEKIRAAIYPGKRIQNVLVLVNPFGGRGKALQIYNTVPRRMFALAAIKTEVVISEYAGHITTYIKALQDLEQYDAVVTVSGDGLFHELLNGILARDDWEASRNIPLGMIAGGTASALNRNLDTMFPAFAALSVVKGRTRPLDIFSYFSEGKLCYSHLNLTWALIADIDIESERLRFLGELRNTLGGLMGILALRKYQGSVYFIPSDEFIGASKGTIESTPARITELYPSHNGPRLSYVTADYSKFSGQLLSQSFTMFNCTSLCWIAPDFLASPHVALNSSTLSLIYSGADLPKSALLASFVDLCRGKYLDMPAVHHHLVKAVVLIPGPCVGDESRKGFLSLSGESMPVAPVGIEVHAAVMKVLAPEHLDESEWLKAYKSFAK